LRTQKLEKLGIVDSILPQNLTASNLAERIIICLNKNRPVHQSQFNLNGAEATANYLKTF